MFGISNWTPCASIRLQHELMQFAELALSEERIRRFWAQFSLAYWIHEFVHGSILWWSWALKMGLIWMPQISKIVRCSGAEWAIDGRTKDVSVCDIILRIPIYSWTQWGQLSVFCINTNYESPLLRNTAEHISRSVEVLWSSDVIPNSIYATSLAEPLIHWHLVNFSPILFCSFHQ